MLYSLSYHSRSLSGLGYVSFPPQSPCEKGYYQLAYSGQVVREKGENIDGAFRIPRSAIKSFDVVGRVGNADGSLVFEMISGQKFRLIDRYNSNDYVVGYLVTPCSLTTFTKSDKCWTYDKNKAFTTSARTTTNFYMSDGVPPPPYADKTRYAGIFEPRGTTGIIREPSTAEMLSPSLQNWVIIAPNGNAVITSKYEIQQQVTTGIEHPDYDAFVTYTYTAESNELLPVACPPVVAPCKPCPTGCRTERRSETYYARKDRTSASDIEVPMVRRFIKCEDIAQSQPHLPCADEIASIKRQFGLSGLYTMRQKNTHYES